MSFLRRRTSAQPTNPSIVGVLRDAPLDSDANLDEVKLPDEPVGDGIQFSAGSLDNILARHFAPGPPGSGADQQAA
ncbi:MAG: hypothetical protein ACREMY_27200, partial [bacterium]